MAPTMGIFRILLLLASCFLVSCSAKYLSSSVLKAAVVPVTSTSGGVALLGRAFQHWPPRHPIRNHGHHPTRHPAHYPTRNHGHHPTRHPVYYTTRQPVHYPTRHPVHHPTRSHVRLTPVNPVWTWQPPKDSERPHLVTAPAQGCPNGLRKIWSKPQMKWIWMCTSTG